MFKAFNWCTVNVVALSLFNTFDQKIFKFLTIFDLSDEVPLNYTLTDKNTTFFILQGYLHE